MHERHRILIVDDDPKDRQAVVEALRLEAAGIDGFDTDVQEADTIALAREALRRGEFACVFLDHGLPDGTSLDLLMELRSQGLATPVVVLTGERDEQTVAEVMRAGAADYLPKDRLRPDLVARSLRAALRFLQAQREKQAALDELRARDRAIAAASNGIVIADPRLPDAPLVYTNAAFLDMTGYAEAEVIGRNCRFLQGLETDPAAVRELREAIRQERPCQVLILNYRKDGSAFWNEVTVSPVRDTRGTLTHFVGIQTDVTARQVADAERRQAEGALQRRAERERFLAELAERARTLTDPNAVIADAVCSVGEFLGVARCVFADIDLAADACTIPLDYCADEAVASMAGTFPISDFGPFLTAEYRAGRTVSVNDTRLEPVRVPAEYLAAYEAIDCRAFVAVPVLHSARLVSVIAVHSAVPRRWTPEEVDLVQAVVERTWLTVEVTRQQRALVREAEERREAHERTTTILESITDAFFTLDHDYRFVYVNSETERLLFRTRAELSGRYIWDVFPEGKDSTFDRQYRRAMTEGGAVAFEEFYPPLNFWLEVRAFPSPDGISVYFRDITERKEAEAERERLLAEERARAERAALLNRIGQALRASTDPGVIQERAGSLLGEALGADRCFYVTYDLLRDQALVSQDWRRDDLPTQAGAYRASDFGPLLRELFPAPRTAVIDDVQTGLSPASAAAFEATRHRAVLVVPFFDAGSLVAALYVSVADAPRVWTADEVALAEQVATLTRTALEAALVREREHRIAEQLQDALQPTLPEHVPGLAVGKFTRPALDEAQIGGDFYDLFPLDKEMYALVIGDVSGKGLAAAQQLALVRNSLRTTLYLYRAPAQAADALNRIVTSHDLLVGFVTAWVGVYDAGTGRVSYCSCGHEPGLVRRTDASVEALETTGPPLGVSENAEYHESAVTLSPGDALLLYTDGISESGPSRREMLGTEGLMRLFGTLPRDPDPQAQAEALVEEVSAFTNGVFRDDVALLLARRL